MNKSSKANKKLIGLFGGLLAVVVLTGYGQMTAQANPGSLNDPLVTKLYVDEQIAAVLALIGQGGAGVGGPSLQVIPGDRDSILGEIMVYFEATYGEALRNAQSAGGQSQVPYDAVFAQAGRTLVAMSGTEMILRGGSAVAVSGINGLCNVTLGVDVVNGMDITLNHLHIVPGSDGRGMRFTTDSYLMIKGEYYFVD